MRNPIVSDYKIHKLAEYSNAFNHYLYELKRSVFGPLT